MFVPSAIRWADVVLRFPRRDSPRHSLPLTPECFDNVASPFRLVRIPIALFGLLLPPASAKRLIKLHKALELVAAVLRQGQLRGE
jgi:hypothetical protein